MVRFALWMYLAVTWNLDVFVTTQKSPSSCNLVKWKDVSFNECAIKLQGNRRIIMPELSIQNKYNTIDIMHTDIAMKLRIILKKYFQMR